MKAGTHVKVLRYEVTGEDGKPTDRGIPGRTGTVTQRYDGSVVSPLNLVSVRLDKTDTCEGRAILVSVGDVEIVDE